MPKDATTTARPATTIAMAPEELRPGQFREISRIQFPLARHFAIAPKQERPEPLPCGVAIPVTVPTLTVTMTALAASHFGGNDSKRQHCRRSA